MEKIEFCCEPYEKMLPTFQWFSYVNDDGVRIFVMPSIDIGGILFRVNFCPSCGKETRSIEIPEDEYLLMTTEVSNG